MSTGPTPSCGMFHASPDNGRCSAPSLPLCEALLLESVWIQTRALAPNVSARIEERCYEMLRDVKRCYGRQRGPYRHHTDHIGTIQDHTGVSVDRIVEIRLGEACTPRIT
eukprot:1288516-Pyramimonas_sp.AAC.2